MFLYTVFPDPTGRVININECNNRAYRYFCRACCKGRLERSQELA